MDEPPGGAPYQPWPPGPPPGPPTRNFRLPIVPVVVVLVVLVLGGVAGWTIGSHGHKKATPPAWFDKADVSVYLCGRNAANARCGNADATPEQKQQIQRELQRIPQVQWVHFLSREQGYEQAKKQFKDDPSIAGTLRPEDVPDAFRVKLKDPEQYRTVVTRIQNLPGVDSVVSRLAPTTK